MPDDPSVALARYWQSLNLVVGHGASEAEVRLFETTHRVKLPPDMRIYFLEQNGMDLRWPNNQDPNGFSFWPLARVRRVPEELAAIGVGVPAFPGMESYFAFADYLDWSWAYAIRLTSVAEDEHPVILIGREAPAEIATSFSEFVELYIADSPRLYGVSA